MKTILYNPIFINPQAYYVFPRLTRYLQPDNESTAEPANYIGTIEVKVIAYGDTTLKRTYTNTDSIDLSEFKNTWIHISLFTKVGSCVLGEWKIGNMESDLPYIDPEVLASLKAVVIVGNKTNNDSDRAIVKNLVDPDNPFVISNAAYEGMSGYNGYPIILSGTNSTYQDKASYTNIVGDDKNIINITRISFNTAAIFSYIKQNGTLTDYNRNIESFKVKVTGIDYSKFVIKYSYISGTNATERTVISITSDGTYELPKSFASDGSLTSDNVWIGLNFTKQSTDIPDIIEDVNVTIEVLPEFEGAFVTDGIDDLITSTKTVQEMGITDEVTVVSMIHQIDLNSTYTIATTNYIENSNSREHVRSDVYNYGKTGIYGYSASLINNTKSDIKNILGDEADYYVKSTNSLQTIFDAKFSVVGRISELTEASQVAWYWTIIANKVLTTDQINQVIAYFNLDRTLKPDILCNTIKQGITNENHAEFGDKLIDFSGNGRDIQLNNIAWKGDSGIGKYETELSNTSIWTQSKETTSSPFSSSYNGLSGWIVFANTAPTNSADMPSFKIQVKGLLEGQELIYRYYDSNGQSNVYSITKDGEYTLPSDVRTAKPQTSNTSGFQVVKDETNIITITQIPSHAGALCLDGVNDFGKVTGMPIYKDYTFIIEREFLNKTFPNQVCLVSKSKVASEIENGGAFIVDNISVNSIINPYSFYKTTSLPGLNTFDRQIVFQSKCKYLDKDIAAGTSTDSDTLWLGTFRDNDSRFANVAIYFLMSFPYSMSEFLIERQLKKHKLGTLYPDMVEFRPVINSNVLLDSKPTFVIRGTSTHLNAGDYVPENSQIWVSIKMNNIADRITKFTVNGKTIDIPENAYSEVTLQYGFPFVIDKSPQKIGITIEQDENYVLFNPVITSNVEYHKLDFYLNNYQKRINIGDYIPKGAYLRANFYLKNNVDELTVFTFNGVNIGYRRSSVDDTAFNIGHIYNYDSPQEVNITIDEYIRYEEIVQPYPVLLRFNDENGNEVSWGGKFRVGSTITRIGSAADSNLLPNIYNIFGLLLNNNQVTSSKVIVEKTMVFKAKSAYIFDNNEPKCILSPSRLRIPNSSYKLLGYIPDISGHGNHGKINNSVYAGMSGVNGYPVVFGANKTWANESNGYVTSITSNTIHITNVLNAGLALLYSYVKYNGNLQNIKEIPPFKIEIKGLEGRSKFIYKYLATSDATKETNLYLGNGTHELPKSFLPTEALINNAVVGFSISPIEEGVTNFLSDITIKVLPEYEGAYCLDGVDDSVNIPTTVGGKQVLMKVNWQKSPALLYDQRASGSFAVLTTLEDDAVNPRIAYQARNQNGKTYIDGIENNNIETYTLKDITHNITIANSSLGGIIVPVIGCNTGKSSNFAKMSLYDFMLFDNISTDDKIKELNEYVGIEGNTEWRKTK